MYQIKTRGRRWWGIVVLVGILIGGLVPARMPISLRLSSVCAETTSDTNNNNSGGYGQVGPGGGFKGARNQEVVLDEDSDEDNQREIEPGDFQATIMAAINSAKNIDGYHYELDIGKRLKSSGSFSGYSPVLKDVPVADELKKIRVSEPVQVSVAYDAEGEILALSFPLPQYNEGDLYVYSDGSSERVEKEFSDVVHWVNYRGNRSSGRPDFTYGRTKWKTSSRTGSRIFSPTQYLLSNPPTTLWPLMLGNRTSFDEDGSWKGKSGVTHSYDAHWRCKVIEKNNVEVAVGDFATMRVGCTRYSNAFSFPGEPGREYRVWDYSPELNHWLIENREYFGLRKDRTKELVAVMPDLRLLLRGDGETQEVQKLFQETLESMSEGAKPVVWRSPDLEVDISLWAKEQFVRIEDGIRCRRYELKVNSEQVDKTYYGLACRNEAGVWRVPRL